jgi:peptidase E
MNLALTSDLPSTPNEAVFGCMRRAGSRPRIAWIAPLTREGRERLPAARRLFASHGFPDLDYCDIDEEPDEARLARLDEYEIVYLSGGDPIAFRRNLLRAGLSARLRRRLAAGRWIVGASGGAMQLTRNVSLFRLRAQALEEVIASRGEHEGLGAVDYEILPHLNRLDATFLETVRQYSEHVRHEVVALADGSALLHEGDARPRCVGRALRLRGGIVTPVEAAA